MGEALREASVGPGRVGWGPREMAGSHSVTPTAPRGHSGGKSRCRTDAGLASCDLQSNGAGGMHLISGLTYSREPGFVAGPFWGAGRARKWSIWGVLPKHSQ